MILGNHLLKFTDDTYLIALAKNVDSWSTEMNNISTWAAMNNLVLNRAKSKEIIFIDPKRKRRFVVPSPLPEIVRDTLVNILGVSFTDNLSASDHVRGVTSNSGQTLYALRVPRAHAMNATALQAISVLYLTSRSQLWGSLLATAGPGLWNS